MLNSLRLKRLTTAACLIAVCLTAGTGVFAARAAEQAPEPAAGTAGLSQAEQLYREGVTLYSKEMYREAQSAFTRALALEPDHELAKDMLKKCEGKIEMVSAGESPSAVQSFDTLDPETIPAAGDGGVPKTADDIKYERTKKLITDGQFYLENKKYGKAKELFEQVLLIDPGNKTAKRLLGEATVGAYGDDINAAWQQRKIDTEKIRLGIEKRKNLPEGSDDIGIKEPPLYVPVEEETYREERELSVIEKALDAPVSIEFDNTHIGRIVEFVADFVSINIVVDARVVAPPRPAAPAGLPGAPGVPGAAPFPGAAPGAFPGAAPGALVPPGAADDRFAGLNALSAARGAGTVGAPGVVPGTTGALTPQLTGEQATDGYVPYVKLEDVPLRDALKALLRPLNLSYSIQPSFLWISTAEKIRTETFEDLETRIYELRNAGAETLFKIVVQNPGGGLQGGGGFGGGGLGGGGFGGGGLG
ncbi:MAG: tetratricopeptide repeat protein, partial [Candidatus Hydrogenedentes bacterium]|nr:tetratricopeptide repeat protein [Candidatus Hydrogenedentota bacterium]